MDLSSDIGLLRREVRDVRAVASNIDHQAGSACPAFRVPPPRAAWSRALRLHAEELRSSLAAIRSAWGHELRDTSVAAIWPVLQRLISATTYVNGEQRCAMQSKAAAPPRSRAALASRSPWCRDGRRGLWRRASKG